MSVGSTASLRHKEVGIVRSVRVNRHSCCCSGEDSYWCVDQLGMGVGHQGTEGHGCRAPGDRGAWVWGTRGQRGMGVGHQGIPSSD